MTHVPTQHPVAANRSRKLIYRQLACALFLMVSLFWAAIGRDSRAGWILMTSPTGADHEGNSLLAYCYLHGENPFMKETIPHVAQIGAFCGSMDAFRMSEYRQNFRLLRGLYSFLAAHIAPLIGVTWAMLLVNWLAWATCALITWRLTVALSQSELAGLLAVILVSGGMGMTTHIGDYSPHLLAFATYYLGIYLIYQSGVYRAPQTWRTHTWLGLYFAIASLAYNTGIMLVGVYLLTAVYRNRWPRLAAAAAIGITARPLWQWLLELRTSIEDVEADYLARSLVLWRELFNHDAYYIAVTVARWLSEYILFFDSPLVVIAGLACCLAIRLQFATRWFVFTSIAIPIMAALVFTPTAAARGYLVYGGSVWLYVCLANQLARGLQNSQRWFRWTTTGFVVLIVVSHFTWSAAHLVHNLGPLKTYFLGWENGIEYLLTARTEVRSLTDHEPTPVLFGGTASLGAAGAVLTDDTHQLTSRQVSFTTALVARAWYFIYFVLLAAVAANTRRARISWIAAIVVLYLVSCVGAALLFRQTAAFFKTDEAVLLRSGQSLRYEIQLGSQFMAAIRRHAAADDALVVFVRAAEEESPRDAATDKNPFNVRLYHNEQVINADYADIGKHVVDRESQQRILAAESLPGRLVVEVTNRGDMDAWLIGWQRGTLPGRSCVVRNGSADESRPAVLPVVELRLLRPNGRIKLAGF